MKPTIEINISPSTLHKYLEALDQDGAGYYFVRTDDGLTNNITLTLEADGCVTKITTMLRPDGTWFAVANIPL